MILCACAGEYECAVFRVQRHFFSCFSLILPITLEGDKDTQPVNLFGAISVYVCMYVYNTTDT